MQVGLFKLKNVNSNGKGIQKLGFQGAPKIISQSQTLLVSFKYCYRCPRSLPALSNIREIWRTLLIALTFCKFNLTFNPQYN